jgi:hypothetical protein
MLEAWRSMHLTLPGSFIQVKCHWTKGLPGKAGSPPLLRPVDFIPGQFARGASTQAQPPLHYHIDDDDPFQNAAIQYLPWRQQAADQGLAGGRDTRFANSRNAPGTRALN